MELKSNNMIKVKKKYIEFKKNEKEIWQNKMVWQSGKKIFNNGNIDKFIKEIKPFTADTIVNTVDEFFIFLDKISVQYKDWAKVQNENYKENDYIDMEHFFKGFFGEYFCYRIAEDTTRLFSQNELYCIRCMAPNLIEEDDNGIDFTAIINDEPSVIQVKWWNKWGDNYLTNAVFQKLGYEGAVAGYTTLTEIPKKNMYFIWLDKEQNAYNIINKNPRTKGRVVVWGKETWDFSINGRDKMFWENLWEKINALAE